MLSYYLEHKVKNTLQNKVVAVASEFEIGVRPCACKTNFNGKIKMQE